MVALLDMVALLATEQMSHESHKTRTKLGILSTVTLIRGVYMDCRDNFTQEIRDLEKRVGRFEEKLGQLVFHHYVI